MMETKAGCPDYVTARFLSRINNPDLGWIQISKFDAGVCYCLLPINGPSPLSQEIYPAQLYQYFLKHSQKSQ